MKFYKLNNLPEDIKEEDIILPKRSTAYSAGYDFFAPEEIVLPANMKKPIIVNSYVKAKLDEDKYLAVHIRSSYGIKHQIRLANITGIIDSDYYNNESNEGHIMFALVNEGDNDVVIPKGEHFAQGIITKYFITENDNTLDSRTGGIGSTTKTKE